MYTTVIIGSNRQEFHLQLDLDSSVTWVVGSGAIAPGSHYVRRFWAHQSDSFQTRYSMGLQLDWYGGIMVGDVGSDDFRLGDHVVSQFSFGIVHSMPSSPVLHNPIDGVFGLSRNIPPGAPYKAFSALLRERGQVGRKLFGTVLCSSADGESAVGEIIFGEICREKAIGQFIHMTMINTKDYWGFSGGKLSVGLGDLQIQLDYVVMDTTSEFIKGPKAKIDRINHHLGFTRHATLGFAVDCGRVDTLHLVQLLSGPRSVTFKPVHYVKKNELGECYSAFRDVGVQSEFWVFGIPAHMDKYVLYNEADEQISFGKADCRELQ